MPVCVCVCVCVYVCVCGVESAGEGGGRREGGLRGCEGAGGARM